jgi:hypothetical protein
MMRRGSRWVGSPKADGVRIYVTSVDGNYIKMQGEALARLQVSYQAETQAQQARAQAASEKALQRLHEEVGSMASSEGQHRGMETVGGRGEGSSETGENPRHRNKSGEGDGESKDVLPLAPEGSGLRLDVRA